MKKFDLLNVLNHTDEALVERAAASMTPKARVGIRLSWRRIGVCAAAVALLVTSLAVTTSLMHSDDPADTTGVPSLQEDSFGNGGDLTPNLSALQMFSLSAWQEEGLLDSVAQEHEIGDNYSLLTFDVPLGGSVTVTTFWKSLSTHAFPNDGHELWAGLDPTDPEDRQAYLDVLKDVRFAGVYSGENSVTLDPAEKFLLWGYEPDDYEQTVRVEQARQREKLESILQIYGEDSEEYRKANQSYEKSAERAGYGGITLSANEDILSYVIRDAEGEITAVGAVYACHKHLLDDPYDIYYDTLFISRYADLGCVRFDSPMTEEEAESHLKEMHASIAEVKAEMDFTPATKSEYYKAGLADLWLTVDFDIPSGSYFSSGFGGSSHEDFRTFYVSIGSAEGDIAVDNLHADRVFRIYSDGTWEEVTDHPMLDTEA